MNGIVTREIGPFIRDELDRLVDMRSTLNFGYVFLAGFFVAMGALALNMSPKVMFQIFLFTFLVAGMTVDISQIYFYRKGIHHG